MKEYLLKLHEQVGEALRLGTKYAIPHSQAPISKVLFCGLGGSAISGDVFRKLASRRERVPFIVYRAMQVPKWVDRQTLVILSSYSGNTQEVLEAFHKVVRTKAQLWIVTSGGKLEELAKRKNISYLKIPKGLPPRCAIGYLTFGLIPALKKKGLIEVSNREINEVTRCLKRSPVSQARSIARKLVGKTVRLYGVSGILEPVLVRWKAQFAENAKTIISSCLLPEMFHNEVEGWKFPKSLVKSSVAVFFKDFDDRKDIQRKRLEAEKSIRRSGGKVLEIKSPKALPLARIFSLIYLGDWVSYELAKLYQIDPLNIPVIESIKKI